LSLNIESGQWLCHRCGAGGLLRERWPQRDPRFNARRASSRRAFALTGIAAPPIGRAGGHEERPGPGRGDRWRLIFQRAPHVGADPGGAYLESRGISIRLAEICGARYLADWPHWEARSRGEWVLQATSRRIVFPVFDQRGELTAIQGRVIAPGEYGPKVLTRGDLTAGVFRTSREAFRSSPVVIVEAPIDALSLASAGVPALALCGTSLPGWMPRALAFRRIALAFDADSAGDEATTKAASAFWAFGCEVERWRPSLKDWNDVLLTHGGETLARTLALDVARGSGSECVQLAGG
jgi:hypothetical protein